MNELIEKIIPKAKGKRVVIAEGWDERVLQATKEIVDGNICQITLLGKEDEIKEKAEKIGLDISKVTIIDWKNSDNKEEYAKQLYELRKHKGMTEEDALKLIEDENYFGAMMVKLGDADALCGSCICPTANLMRPALQIFKTAEGSKLVNEVMVWEDTETKKVYFTTDSSLNISPDEEGLAQMAINASHCAKNFGVEPKVALLSFSTKGSGGKCPFVDLILEALKIVKEREPSLIIDGELQFDAAINPDSAKRKCPDSPLKGDANVLVFPDLNSSNIAAHSWAQISRFKWLFSSMQGIGKALTIYGRSSDAELIKNQTIMAASES
ncbi:phosphate acyltransferase [Nanoarchaeota archaeon]